MRLLDALNFVDDMLDLYRAVEPHLRTTPLTVTPEVGPMTNAPVPRSPFADEDPKDRSPIHLAEDGVEGHGLELEGGAWQLVVTLPEPHPRMIVTPRAGRAGLGGVATGDPGFDRRVAVLGDDIALPTLGHAVRVLWAKARCDWLYAQGTLTATLPRFGSRQHQLEQLAHGVLLGEALVGAQDLSPPALLRGLSDPSFEVARAAFDMLLGHPSSPELIEAYGQLLSDRSASRARLRVHALGVAQDWAALVDEVRGLDPMARSEAFVILVTRGPRDLAAQAALVALGSSDALDPERVRWLIDRLRDRDARLLAATTPDLRDRFLVGHIETAPESLADAATELLAARGTAVALRELEASGPKALRAAALARRIRARLAGGNLAVVDEAARGGLTVADPDEGDQHA